MRLLVPRSRGGALWRFALGGVLVITCTAAATAVAGLLQFKTIAQEIGVTPAIKRAQVVVPQPGDPQTILIIGSDHRAGEPQSAANSDTMILVRLNPNSSTINVLSVPRDLKVNIQLPGGGIETAKLNASYPAGGPNLVVKTIERQVFPQLKVNHIIDINFAGFRDLVNAIGCVYTDVDRRYYNVNLGTSATNFSNINLQPGYQKLCGDDALAYVRYRHTDTDIVRSARQQDFIRDAKDQYGQTRLIENRDRLLRIFGRHAQTDANLHSIDGLINLFNLVAFSDAHAIREVHFPAILQPCTPPAPCYVLATPQAEAAAYRQFMAVVKPPSGGPGSRSGGAAGAGAAHAAPARVGRPAAIGLQSDLADGKVQVHAMRTGLPVYVPHLIVAGTAYQGPTAGAYPRSYLVHDQRGRAHPSYRIVLAFNAVMGQFYGVQGTTWKNPPILAGPSAIQYVGGKRLQLYKDGSHLRLVAWRTPRAAYWISNTLSLDLSNAQMVAMAASLTRVG